MSVEPRFSRLRLVIPSIAQGNPGGYKGGAVWCGRTSAAMIHNYFTANREGGVAATKSKLIVNQRDKAPFDLVFGDTHKVAVDGFDLAGCVRRQKASYKLYAERQGADQKPLWPMGARGGVPSPTQQLEILAPILCALEAFNPVLFYSGLSSNADQSRHIVVISGYRWARGELWLHIDDPSSRYTEKEGKPESWFLCGALTDPKAEPGRSLASQLVQLPADSGTDEPARRYLLRASRLFEPNLHSKRADDCWCDHSDSPGFTVLLSLEQEQKRELVECDTGEPGLPLELSASATSKLAGLEAARAQARAAGAPFPLGSNRWWHDGVHLFVEEEHAVRPLACGELVTARLPATGSDGRDHGAMVFRHDFDPHSGTVVVAGEPKPDGAIPFYTMLVHLACDVEPIRARLDPGAEPERTVLTGTALHLLAHDEHGDVQTLADDLKAAKDYARSVGVTVGDLVALPIDDTDERAWGGAAPARPIAPVDAVHALQDGDTRYPMTGTPRQRIELAIDERDWTLVERTHADAHHFCPWQKPGVVQIDGASMMCSHDKRERDALAQGTAAVMRGAGTVLAALGKGTVRLSVDWPATPVVLPCDDDGVLQAELHARIEPRQRKAIERAIASGATPRVLASLEIVAGAQRFRVRGQVNVELAAGVDPSTTDALVRCDSLQVVQRARHCCVHAASDGAALAAMSEDAPVISLRADTKLRARIGDGRACTLDVKELRAYGDPKSPYDARVRLEPVVGVADAKWDELANAFAQRRAAAHGDVHARLVAKQSRLAAVRIDDKGSWKRQGAVVFPKDGAQHDIWLDLVPSWRVAKDSRRALAGLASSLRLPLLRVFASGPRTFAVIEVRIAAREADFVDTLIQRWQTRVALRDRVVAALTDGSWADFAAIERDVATADDPAEALQSWRALARDVVASAGLVEPDRRGVHVQLCSVDPLFPDDDAHGRWPELGEVSGAPLSREFFDAAVREVIGDIATPSAQRVLRALDRGGIDPDTWRAFCADAESERLLARRVAVHESEWTIDWKSAAKDAARIALDPALAAWPDDPAKLGLPTGKLRFYHPLRALEWLGTGVDVTVASTTVDAVELELASTTIDLSPRRRGDGYVAGMRLLLGEVRGPKLNAKLHVKGHTHGDEPLPIVLTRGEVERLWVCKPDVAIAPTAVDEGQTFALAVRRGDPEPDPKITHLLADGSQRLDRAWESRASLTITATWNLRPPERLAITLAGQHFAFDGKPTTNHPGVAITATGDGWEVAIPFDPAEPFTGPRTLQLTVSVVADTTLDAKGKVNVEASGGDLAQTIQLAHEVATRKLALGTRGRDVAKVQLYLSQIRACGVPCLMPSGKDQCAAIDGTYDDQLALALWTFALAFAGRGEWKAKQLSCPGGALQIDAPKWSRPTGASDEQAWPALCNAADASYRAHGALVVDAALIDELVRHFDLPFIVPLVELSVAKPQLAGPPAAYVAALDAKTSARLLPVPDLDPHNVVRLAVKLAAGFDRTHAEQTSVELDDGGGDYQLRGASRRTLADLLDHGIVLDPSGTIGSKADHNRIALAVDGVAIGSLGLAGTRSLHALANGRGLDVLLVQQWLTQQLDAQGHPLLAKVDGAWGKHGAAALQRFVALHGPCEYAQELRDLATPVSWAPAVQPEAHAP
ncbi:MAG TPA: hypothetical protein VG755_03395 [Nannocystaceae bacterium]|nr:hypothetical protein [Nannocystaceae bacterium]